MLFRLALGFCLLNAAFTPARGFAQTCVDDEALAEAASHIVLSGARGDYLRHARDRGSDRPVLEALDLPRADPARRRRFLRRVAARRPDAPLACGEAEGPDRVLLLVAPLAGRLHPLADGAFAVELADGWRDGAVVALDATGRSVRQPARGGTVVDLPGALATPLTVQLLASGPGGPAVVAVRQVGEAEVSGAALPPASDDLLGALNGWRAPDAGPPLRPNRRLDDLADAHAEHVCRGGRVVHTADGEDPAARLRAYGMRARHVGEVVARAATAGEALVALTRSPAHRQALVDRRFTDAGVGVAADADGRRCLVVLLAAWPRVLASAPTPREREAAADPELGEPAGGDRDE